MKALIYEGPGSPTWKEVPDPAILDPEDAIIRVDAVTICGTDLHILKGDVPSVEHGRVLGHEAVGTIQSVGSAVTDRAPGDRVLISCISSCGRCRYCREQRYGQCLGGGGWILGNIIDGTQAELVRVPFASRSTYVLPDDVSDEEAVMLADILPTSYEVGVLNGCVEPGNTIVIVGAGPIGLAAIATARLMSPLNIVVVDPAAPRRDAAKMAGATVTMSPDEDVRGVVFGMTDNLGADVAIEAVGIPSSFELCTQLIRPGGHVANVGVHGSPVTLHLEELWIRNVTITTGLVDTYSTSLLLKLLQSGQLATKDLITHRFDLDEMETAYDVFSRPTETGALKVALFSRDSMRGSTREA
ncbi:MAG: zinc-dependent alcohol dehydrogenase family protein [Aeromicrobium sp.]